MRVTKFTTWLAAAASTMACAVHAATYYVATTGSDANAGTSLSAPWRTVQHAMDIAVAGDH